MTPRRRSTGATAQSWRIARPQLAVSLVVVSSILLVHDTTALLPARASCPAQRQHHHGSRSGSGGGRRAARRMRVEASSLVDSLGFEVYKLQAWAGQAAAVQLGGAVDAGTVGVLYGAGLLSALSPCALSLLPITVGYLASEAQAMQQAEQVKTPGEPGTTADAAGAEAGADRGALFALSLTFAAGLASALAALGILATALGQIWGSVSGGAANHVLPVVASVFSVACGLNLLEVLQFDIPFLSGQALKVDQAEIQSTTPFSTRATRAFAVGVSSALVSSPCSTPVLASLLGFVAASDNTGLNLGLLLTYTAGFATPVVAAGAVGVQATSTATQSGSDMSFTANLILGGLLVGFGVYSGLDALLPAGLFLG